MKKEILVCLFTSLMVLTACGKASPKEETSTYLEDTLLHEDVFDLGVARIKTARNLNPVENGEPKIGIQYAYDDVNEKVSIRYVAAINIPDGQLANYSASWTRAVYNADGTQRLASGSVDCTKVYTQLNDNTSTVTPSAFGEYNYFVVYTLRNVPASNFGGVLYASLTVNDGTSDVVSNYITTTLNVESNAIRTSLTSADLAIDGYFLKGTIEGEAGSTRTGTPQEGHYSVKFDGDLYENDKFVAIYQHENTFKFLNPTLDGDNSSSSFTNSNGLISVNSFNLYHLYLTIENKLQTVIDFPTDRILRFTNMSGTEDSLTLYAFENIDNHCWIWNIVDTNSGKFPAEITGRFLYEDSEGNKSIYEDFNLSMTTSWNAVFASPTVIGESKTIGVTATLSITFNGVRFDATGEEWRNALIGPKIEGISGLEALLDNPRVVKSSASAPEDHSLYLYVFATNNPTGFSWPHSNPRPILVYGVYIMVNSTSIANVSRFKYNLNGWDSSFVNKDDVSNQYIKDNGKLHVVLGGDSFHFDIEENDWKMAILGPSA